MFRRPAQSIRSKLLMVVMVTSFTALACATAALLFYESRTYEESRVSELETLADVLGAALGPALAFNDQPEAQEKLSLLRARPSVYAPEQLYQNALPKPGTDTHVIRGDRLILSKSIVEKGERVGTLYLVARYEAVRRLIDSGLIVGVVVLLSLFVSGLVSAWLGRKLTTPILDVTDAAHHVMEQRDFSVRVKKTTVDEIGYLVDAFNAMLDEVGRRSAALEDADRKKDQFLAVLAHELRNPLNPIRNAVAVLRMTRADPRRVDWAGEVIDRQARMLARLLDDLMDVARITQNKIELRMQIVDLGSIVDMAVETTRATFEANQQTLEVQKVPEPVYVRGDPARLGQVLGNILSNAAKYTEPYGRIRLSVAQREKLVTVTVRDSGVGIAPENMSKIFDMFVQVSGKTSGGLGIGLALVRALIGMHGGSVEARSEGEGKGSEFAITLPVAERPDLVLHNPLANVEAGADRGLRILVADDVVDSMESMALALQILGHEVRTASDGTSALDAAVAFQPDVAILDIGMPGLTGYAIATRIRQHEWGRRMLLIALTGWGQRDDINQAHASGFNHHMTKPADFHAIKRLIDEFTAARDGALDTTPAGA